MDQTGLDFGMGTNPGVCNSEYRVCDVRRSTLWYCSVIASLLLSACSSPRHLPPDEDDGIIEVAILQMNDVYEIAGVDNGRSGGLARVAHFYKTLEREYPQSMLVLAGDFLNPSLVGTMKVDGERVNGRQMVETLNAMDLDLVAFGNHEFDLDEEDLQKRIDSSEFDWIASNIQQVCGDRHYPFYKNVDGRKQFMPASKVYTFRDGDGTEMRLGILSATLNMNPREYVHYYDVDSCVGVEMELLRDVSDVIIGLTHVTMEQDEELARTYQDIDLIMGGHEHDHMERKVDGTIITKADANAKTVYKHVLRYETVSENLQIESSLIRIDTTIPRDPAVAEIVERWVSLLNTRIRDVIEDPYEIVYHSDEPLDGRESSIRHRQTNMGTLFASAMLASSRHGARAALLNSGSIRVDDQIEGDILAIDIFRALPFGGSIIEARLTGELLEKLLDFSENARGSGAHLLYAGLAKQGDHWSVAGAPIRHEDTYVIAVNDFLLRGFDIPFLTDEHPGILDVYSPGNMDKTDLRTDIRKAIIAYLRRQ